MQKQKTGCMFPDCETNKPAQIRGLCIDHYHLCLHTVNKKIRTWEDFERNGYCLGASKGRTSKTAKHFYEVVAKMK